MIATRVRLLGVLAGCGLFTLTGGQATAQSVRLTKLSDVTFGALSSTATDVPQRQNVCAYSTALSGMYTVRISGSGSGGALTLAGVGAPMPYEVQWAGSPNQTSGTALPANMTVGGFSDGNVLQTCNLLATSSATLIVLLRAAALSSATAGNYSGTLTILLGAQ